MNGKSLTVYTYTNTPPKRLGCGFFFLIKTDIMKQYDVNIMNKCIDGILGNQFKDKFTDFKYMAVVISH